MADRGERDEQRGDEERVMLDGNPIFSWRALFVPFLIEVEASGLLLIRCVRIFGIRVALIASIRK